MINSAIRGVPTKNRKLLLSRDVWGENNDIKVIELAPSKVLDKEMKKAVKDGTMTKSRFEKEFLPRYITELKSRPAAEEALKELVERSKTEDLTLTDLYKDDDATPKNFILGLLAKAGAKVDDRNIGRLYHYVDDWRNTPKHPKKPNSYGLIVAGSRGINDETFIANQLKSIFPNLTTTNGGEEITIIEGGARGVDQIAGKYADENGINHITMPAEWDKWTYLLGERGGKQAGFLRNEQMAYKAAAEFTHGGVICFWDGKSNGTKDNITNARQYGLELCVYDVPNHRVLSEQELNEMVDGGLHHPTTGIDCPMSVNSMNYQTQSYVNPSYQDPAYDQNENIEMPIDILQQVPPDTLTQPIIPQAPTAPMTQATSPIMSMTPDWSKSPMTPENNYELEMDNNGFIKVDQPGNPAPMLYDEEAITQMEEANGAVRISPKEFQEMAARSTYENIDTLYADAVAAQNPPMTQNESYIQNQAPGSMEVI